jgi:hypothetical protein
MADNNKVTPDGLATKLFLITIIGAFTYMTVVYSYVIGGNRRMERETPQLTKVEHHD